MTGQWQTIEEIKYWWRAWRLYGCGNFTLRQIRDALKRYDAAPTQGKGYVRVVEHE